MAKLRLEVIGSASTVNYIIEHYKIGSKGRAIRPEPKPTGSNRTIVHAGQKTAFALAQALQHSGIKVSSPIERIAPTRGEHFLYDGDDWINQQIRRQLVNPNILISQSERGTLPFASQDDFRGKEIRPREPLIELNPGFQEGLPPTLTGDAFENLLENCADSPPPVGTKAVALLLALSKITEAANQVEGPKVEPHHLVEIDPTRGCLYLKPFPENGGLWPAIERYVKNAGDNNFLGQRAAERVIDEILSSVDTNFVGRLKALAERSRTTEGSTSNSSAQPEVVSPEQRRRIREDRRRMKEYGRNLAALGPERAPAIHNTVSLVVEELNKDKDLKNIGIRPYHLVDFIEPTDKKNQGHSRIASLRRINEIYSPLSWAMWNMIHTIEDRTRLTCDEAEEELKVAIAQALDAEGFREALRELVANSS